MQLAVVSRARVIVQVNRPERRNDARQLGAHRAVVSLDESSVGQFHLVLDAVGGPQLIQVGDTSPGAGGDRRALRQPGGGTDDFRLRDFYQAGAYNARVIAFISTVSGETKGEDLDILARLVADNRLRPQIGWTGDWTQTAEAFAAMARRAFPGKAVLTVPSPGMRPGSPPAAADRSGRSRAQG